MEQGAQSSQAGNTNWKLCKSLCKSKSCLVDEIKPGGRRGRPSGSWTFRALLAYPIGVELGFTWEFLQQRTPRMKNNCHPLIVLKLYEPRQDPLKNSFHSVRVTLENLKST